MNKDNDFQSKYQKLKEEFETYQDFAENTIQMLNEKNTKLEKNLDALTNIVEISKYINSNVSDDNLIPMINDMIIGILGVTYSSIYLVEDNTKKLIIKATNMKGIDFNLVKNKLFDMLGNGKSFVINCKETIFKDIAEKQQIHSIIGVPIYLGDKFKGYIVVEHTLCNFFSQDHITFISSIANQIGIALENNFLYSKIRENSIRDPLMGIYNRRHFFNCIEGKVESSPNEGFAIVMVDIDNFKKVNDTYGHQFGDKVLVEIAGILQKNIENEDYVARYGGEEIVIYINRANDYSEVFQRIETIRRQISSNIIEYGDIKKSVTASFGISYYPQDGETLQKVIGVADAMLYYAKNSGRNKVVSA